MRLKPFRNFQKMLDKKQKIHYNNNVNKNKKRFCNYNNAN